MASARIMRGLQEKSKYNMGNKSSQVSSSWVGKTELAVLLAVYALACLLFALGLTLPMMTLTKFLVLKNTVSLLSGIAALFSSGNQLLALTVAVFSVAMPILKLMLIGILIVAKGRIDSRTRRWFRLMHDYGRWGMLDVFVVAVIIVAVKLRALARTEVHTGLYCFGASVLLMMILTHRLSAIYQAAERAEKTAARN